MSCWKEISAVVTKFEAQIPEKFLMPSPIPIYDLETRNVLILQRMTLLMEGPKCFSIKTIFCLTVCYREGEVLLDWHTTFDINKCYTTTLKETPNFSAGKHHVEKWVFFIRHRWRLFVVWWHTHRRRNNFDHKNESKFPAASWMLPLFHFQD